MLIKVIGDGFGARSLKYFIKKVLNYDKIITYVPPNKIPVTIQCQNHTHTLRQLSDASRFWGGLLCVKHEDIGVLNNLGVGLNLVNSASHETQNAYLKVDPKKFFKRFSSLEEEYELLPFNFLKNDEFKAQLLNSEDGPVFVCLGALLTPLFLSTHTIENFDHFFYDNIMQFRDNVENNIEKIDYTNGAAQFVSDRLIGKNVGHTVSLHRRISFREGTGGTNAYYSIMSRGIIRHLISIANPVSCYSLKDLKYNLSKVEHQIDVTTNTKSQQYFYDGSKLVIKPNFPDNSVSAFHFHGSISSATEKKLRGSDIHICDASSLRNLNGLNPIGSIIAQSARKVAQISVK